MKPLERVKNGVWELSLGYVWVHSNATDIWQSNIVDERANTEVCGYVTGLIDQIDTTNLFAQYDDEFHRFMESVKNGTASIGGGNGDLIRTFTNFGQMLFKYVGGALTLQSWYHPDNVPKDPFEEEEEANAKKKAAAISGSAATDVSGKKTTTVSGSSESNTTGKINTISGKSEKLED